MRYTKTPTLAQIVEFIREAEGRDDIHPETIGAYKREFKIRSLQIIATEICESIFEGYLFCECDEDGVDIYRTASLPDAKSQEYRVRDDSPDSAFADIRLSIIIADDWGPEALFNVIPDGIEGEFEDTYVRRSPWKAAFLDELRVYPRFKEVFDDWLSKEHLDYAIPVFRGEVIHPAVLAAQEAA